MYMIVWRRRLRVSSIATLTCKSCILIDINSQQLSYIKFQPWREKSGDALRIHRSKTLLMPKFSRDESQLNAQLLHVFIRLVHQNRMLLLLPTEDQKCQKGYAVKKPRSFEAYNSQTCGEKSLQSLGTNSNMTSSRKQLLNGFKEAKFKDLLLICICTEAIWGIPR